MPFRRSCSVARGIGKGDVNLFVDSLLSNNTDLRIHEGVIAPHRVGFAKSVTPPAYGLRRDGFRAARPSSRRPLFVFYSQPLHTQ